MNDQPQKHPSVSRFEAYVVRREQIKMLREFIAKCDAKKAEAAAQLFELEKPLREMYLAAKQESERKSVSIRDMIANADTVKDNRVRHTPKDMPAVAPPSTSKVLPKTEAILIWDLKKVNNEE